jgi:hypothetical protein
VHALRTLVRQLREMKDVIGGEMVDKFVRLASDQDDRAEEDGGAKLKQVLAPLVRGACHVDVVALAQQPGLTSG